MANLSSRNQQVRQSSAPISAGKAGFIQQYAGTSAPSGWLECSGQAVSRTDYAQLFANVGTKYGVGDGSTTFNLPDGPRRTNEVDLSLSSTPTGWSTTTATGHLEQSAEGQLYLHFLIQGAYTTSTGNQSITIDGISASINGQAVACMGEASAGYNAFFNSGVITMYTGGTGTNDLRVQGRIIIDSASDTFVSADADYSTLSEAWESIPIIKLYDDVADAVSVGVAEATASELGTIKKPAGSVRLDTGNGRGSTNLTVRRFTNSTVTGDAFTYVDSATDGMSITANRDMLVSAFYSDVDGATYQLGVIVNGTGTDLTSSAPLTIAASKRMASGEFAANYRSSVTTSVFRVSAGDIIRAQQSNTTYNDGSDVTVFHIEEVIRL